MKIALLGSTGTLGKPILQCALDAGHEVTVLVRSPEKLGDMRDKVKIVEGQLQDKAALEKTFEGCEAVLNVSAGQKEPNQDLLFKEIAENIVATMSSLGIKRLVNMSGAVTQLPGETLNFKRKMIRFLVNMLNNGMIPANNAVLEVLLSHKEIDWVILRPAIITDKPANGIIVGDETTMPGGSITRIDLGNFMLAQLTSNEWLHKAPFIGATK